MRLLAEIPAVNWDSIKSEGIREIKKNSICVKAYKIAWHSP
jgi:hypothetical protein